MEKIVYTREEAIAELKETQEAAKECYERGIDDSYYTDHASFLNRQLFLIDRKNQAK